VTVAAYLVATALTAADVACVEAGQDWREVDAVLQVVRNRAETSETTLFDVLSRPRQFAHQCPRRRLHWRHLWAGIRMVADALEVPDWLRDASVRWFCAREAAWKWNERDYLLWSRRLEVVGELRHLYWRSRG
jgi:hypothetical protein